MFVRFLVGNYVAEGFVVVILVCFQTGEHKQEGQQCIMFYRYNIYQKHGKP